MLITSNKEPPQQQLDRCLTRPGIQSGHHSQAEWTQKINHHTSQESNIFSRQIYYWPLCWIESGWRWDILGLVVVSFSLKQPIFDHFWSTKKGNWVQLNTAFTPSTVVMMVSFSFQWFIRKPASFYKADSLGTAQDFAWRGAFCLRNAHLRKSGSKNSGCL